MIAISIIFGAIICVVVSLSILELCDSGLESWWGLGVATLTIVGGLFFLGLAISHTAMQDYKAIAIIEPKVHSIDALKECKTIINGETIILDYYRNKVVGVKHIEKCEANGYYFWVKIRKEKYNVIYND